MTEPTPTPAPTTSTQETHPWRATLRTVFVAVVALITVIPTFLADAHLDQGVYGAQVLIVVAAVSRLLANPFVNDFLRQYVPWLAPESSK